MNIKVDESLCIGCGACTAICPNVFEMNDAGISVTKVNPVPEADKQAATEAKESCPVGAIVSE